MKSSKKIIIGTIITVVAFASISLRIYFTWSYRAMYDADVTSKELMKIKENLSIVKEEFYWAKPLVSTNYPKTIIFHHAAINSITAKEVNKLHQDKGWNGIGYHYFISKDGIIYEGRPENAEGAHTIGKNRSSIGICVEGNLEEEEITTEQVKALEDLAVYICLKYDIKEIAGHRDFSNTLCPGKNFPLEDIKNQIIERIKAIGIQKNYKE